MYSCNAVIKLSGKIPSQALLLCFPECLHSILFIYLYIKYYYNNMYSNIITLVTITQI